MSKTGVNRAFPTENPPPPITAEQRKLAIKILPPEIIDLFKECRQVFGSHMVKLEIKK